jgi:cytochrome c oxidase subunit 2
MGGRLLRACLVVAALAAAGCTGIQPTLAPGGPEARAIADLGWLVLVTFVAVTVVMWALIAWVGVRRTGSLATHAAWNAPSDRRWIYAGGIVVPILVLGTIFVLTLRTMAAFPMGHGDETPPPADLRIVGHQWWWEIDYRMGELQQHVVTANELHIPAGRPVDIELVTRDVIHSFWVPRLHGKVDLVPGLVNRIRIEADEPGLYRGECAEFCGPQHARMILLVRAETPADFEAWLAGQRQPAAPPATSQAAHGQNVFLTSACVLCHTVRGTAAHGQIGPDLTHLASRAGIAANAYPNNTAYLQAWVTHAQSLKPYAQMPNITAFTGEDLQALVAYLRGLE